MDGVGGLLLDIYFSLHLKFCQLSLYIGQWPLKHLLPAHVSLFSFGG